MLTLKLSRKDVQSTIGAFPVALLQLEYTAEGWSEPATAEVETDMRLLDLYKGGGSMLASAGVFAWQLADEIEATRGAEAANEFIAEWNLLSHQKLSPVGSNEEQS